MNGAVRNGPAQSTCSIHPTYFESSTAGEGVLGAYSCMGQNLPSPIPGSGVVLPQRQGKGVSPTPSAECRSLPGTEFADGPERTVYEIFLDLVTRMLSKPMPVCSY